MKQSVFDSFTNLYSLSKTLRFELRPVGATLKNLKNNGIIDRDIERDEDYETMKEVFDDLHHKFITESLEQSKIEDREDFAVWYTEYKKKMRDRKSLTEKERKDLLKELDSRLSSLRKKICELYATTAIHRKEKDERKNEKGKPYLSANGYNVLTEKWTLEVLKKIHSNSDEKLEVIKRFDGFFTYFFGFNQNRINYYSADDKSTAIAYRIVDQNLLTFCNNIQLFDKISVVGLSEDEEKIFDPYFYNNCLTQEGIDHYNAIVGGRINDEWQRVSDGINQRINEYSQKQGIKLPQLKKLYKQIWSPKNNIIPFITIENDTELKDILQTFMLESEQNNKIISELVTNICNERYELDKIWITKTSLNILSNKYFADWFTLQEQWVTLWIFGKKTKNGEDHITIPKHISLSQLKSILENITIDDNLHDSEKATSLFKSHREELRQDNENNRMLFLRILQEDFTNYFATKKVQDQKRSYTILGYTDAYKKLTDAIDSLDRKKHKDTIKWFADSAINIVRFIKLFTLKDESLDSDDGFYNELDHVLQDYPATKLYDAIRNYITKKPFSKEKMKLNFDASTLLAGRDKNKETQNLSVILKDNGNYYLAIMKKDNNKFFEQNELYDTSDTNNILYKMDYKLLPWPNKMLPKCLMPGKDKKKYGASDEVLRLYKAGEFKKGDLFKKSSLHILIDFYKSWLKKYVDRQIFNFSFKPTEQYEDISQFYADVEKQWYLLSWRTINKDHLLDHVNNNDVYLFQIYSKDFSPDAKGKEKLQTLYWKNLFEEWSNIKLNGEAEVFFRKKSIDKEKKQLKENNYDVFKHKRYSEDRFLFHVPITLWFGNKGWSKFNQTTNATIQKHHEDINIIGIDRGEKHLAFYSVIDPQGKILEQGTLNTINGIDYEEKLKEKADTRLAARQNWETIGNIKNLKEWYISQVVRKIADLVLKYNAFVVFEDLNVWFKRGRQKIEQSVYQKLELAIAKKFNFLVNKNTSLWEPWSATHAYQLTPPITTFGDIKGKQRGVILYTRANYTSTTDPITGFRKNLYLKRRKKKDMIDNVSLFDTIGYDEKQWAYFFSYDPTKFNEWRGDRKRTVWSCVDRFRGYKNSHGQRENKAINPTQELDTLFDKYNIIQSQDILSDINKRDDLSVDFYHSLIWIFDIILQIRNTGNMDEDSDFVHSPVAPFFDSRIWKKKCPDESSNSLSEPTSGDANGAYNIARKWLMMIERIKNNPERPDLYISDYDRDGFFDR